MPTIIQEHDNYRGEIERNGVTEKPWVVLVNNSPACLVLANWFLAAHEIAEAYAEHTGFDRSSITCFQFGCNILKARQAPQ